MTRWLAIVAGVALSFPGASTSASTHAAASGTLTYCSSINYPPEEFYNGVVTRGRELRPRPVGSDIDVGSEVASRLGLDAVFVHRTFSTIIGDLLAKRCDAVISGMNDTPARRRLVTFVNYLSVGQSLMVEKSNPHAIAKPADLSGKAVSVESNTTDEAYLRQQSKRLVGSGKKPIAIVSYAADTAAAAALKKGKVAAYFGDSPVVAYYAHDDSLALAGKPVNTLPVGIALRKGDERIPRIRQAISAMYADGTMKRILARWNMSAFALKT
jgi:polar amino acid transport system substrate-binding protein